MSSEAKKALRAKLFAEKRKSRIVELEDGLKVEVRQSTVGNMLDAIAIDDQKQRMAKLLMSSCYIPETTEQLFDPEDVELIMEMPVGGYYQKLIDALNKDSLEAKVEDAKKLSDQAGPSTTST